MPASSFLALPPCGSSSVLLAEDPYLPNALGVLVGRRHRQSGMAPLSSPSFPAVPTPAEVEREQEARALGWTPVLKGWRGGIPTSGCSLGFPRRL